MKSKKGSVVIWLQVLLGIFVVAVAYIISTWVLYGNITPTFYPQLAAINNTTSSLNTTAMENTINIINIVWTLWPLVFIIGLIIWGFAASQHWEYQRQIM